MISSSSFTASFAFDAWQYVVVSCLFRSWFVVNELPHHENSNCSNFQVLAVFMMGRPMGTLTNEKLPIVIAMLCACGWSDEFITIVISN